MQAVACKISSSRRAVTSTHLPLPVVIKVLFNYIHTRTVGDRKRLFLFKSALKIYTSPKTPFVIDTLLKNELNE